MASSCLGGADSDQSREDGNLVGQDHDSFVTLDLECLCVKEDLSKSGVRDL